MSAFLQSRRSDKQEIAIFRGRFRPKAVFSLTVTYNHPHGLMSGLVLPSSFNIGGC